MIVRLTLAALFVVPAVMAYPWQATTDRWLLGVAVAAVVILFAWWRGCFVTTMVARRIALLTRRGAIVLPRQEPGYATVALRLTPRESTELPLALVAGYLDRYGIRFDKVRVTSRDVGGARTTWVGLTLRAADNVAALSARSSHIPVQDTAHLAARRLADHLREIGWEVTLDDHPPALVAGQSKETWRGVKDGASHLAAYRVAVDEQLTDIVTSVWSCDAEEIWTAIEFTGARTHPEVAAACAVRTTEKPPAGAPVAGLTPERGRQGHALTALEPESNQRLSAQPVPISQGMLTALRWPVGAELSRT
ncbi:type VII secretion protein EccE [Mycobacterium sp. ITM-2017-0098]|nr:type VII secretion protein EccE [Mycobacterium sp. ITM-2017-0098]